MKAQWTSVLGSRAFLDVMVGNWWNFFPLRPVNDYGLYDGPWGPGRVDTRQQPDLRRRRQQRLPGPEALEAAGLRQPVVLQGRLGRQPRLQGRLRHQARSPQPVPRSAVRRLLPRPNGAALRRSTSTTPTSPASTTSINQAVWLNDTWKLNNRLTMNLGLRYEHYPTSGRSRSSRPTASRRWPAGTTRATRRSSLRARSKRAPWPTPRRLAARRLRLRRHRRQPHGGQGLLRPEPLELGRRAGRQGEPGRHRAAALRLPAVHADPPHAVRPERQPAARQPGRARRVQLDAGRRRLRHRRPRPQSPGHQRALDQPRARGGHRPVGARLLRLQGHARHLGRGRPDPHAAVHRALHHHRSGARQHRRQRRRPDVPDLRHPGRPSARTASTPTPRATTPTSRPWKWR